MQINRVFKITINVFKYIAKNMLIHCFKNITGILKKGVVAKIQIAKITPLPPPFRSMALILISRFFQRHSVYTATG